VLVLGEAHVYLISHFSYYQYNLSEIVSEYYKIISHKEILINHINRNITYVNNLKTCVNILEFNCARLQDKIKIINVKRTRRGIMSGLGTIIKTITGKLDSNDGRKYKQLFEKIDSNMQKLQRLNVENIRLNKEMILKFNNQINNLKHNEEILETQIIETKGIVETIYNWRSVLEGEINKICLDYLDDIIIFGTNLKQHVETIRRVFKELKEYNLKIEIDKSEFLMKEVAYLGHIISQEGIKPNPNKIDIIKKYPIPKTNREIKSYLGLLGYYRKFIPNFANLMKPFTNCLRKGNIYIRWRIKLDEYDFEIKYKAGKLNSNADALSRIRPPFEIINTNENILDKGQNIVHCISNDKVLKNELQNKLTRDLIAENF